MGTNYYLREKACECCGQYGKEVHIGKSSAGWCFSLHIWKGNNDWHFEDAGFETPTTFDHWKVMLNNPNCVIVDEYERLVSKEDMIDIITNRSWPERDYEPGYLARNQAEQGPNGLLRSKVDNHHCLGHGEGTYDYIYGEFS